MRWLYIIPCALLSVTLVACEESLVEPVTVPDGFNTPSFTVTKDTWVDTYDANGVVSHIACANDGAGEDVLWFGTADYYSWSRTTPSGNVIRNCKFYYDTDVPMGFVGQESDDLWNLVKAEDNCGDVTKANGPQWVEHWQANEFYANQDGDKIHARYKYQKLIDADGDVKLERYEETYNCPGGS